MKGRIYPSYSDLLREDVDVTVEKVSQEKSFGTKEGFNNGMCAGLSTIHILRQLRSKHGNTENPFKNPETFQKSSSIQNNCHDEACLIDVIEKELSLPLKEKSFKCNPTHSLEQRLKEEVIKSQQDGAKRGLLIGLDAKRFAKSGRPASGGHMLSMTIQSESGEVYCTGMDSNIFFSKGRGESACNAIAKKIAETADAYDSKKTYTYTVTIPK